MHCRGFRSSVLALVALSVACSRGVLTQPVAAVAGSDAPGLDGELEGRPLSAHDAGSFAAGEAPDEPVAAMPPADKAKSDVQWDAAAAAALDAGATPPCLEDDLDAGASSVIEGDVVVATQAEVEELRGVREVRGSLTIRGRQSTSITSLEALECLSAVGRLHISHNDHLGSLAGLEGLRDSGELLSIDHATSLWDLRPLRGLRSVRSLTVWLLPMVRDLDGLQGIRSLQGGVTIAENKGLVGLDGLDQLQSLGGDLRIYRNPRLSRCLAEEFADRLGHRCEAFGTLPPVHCSGICTCTGNRNDVTCQ